MEILRNSAGAVSFTLYLDGVPADADGVPKVTISRDSDGSDVVTGADAERVGTGIYAYSLEPGQLAELDLLHATLVASLGGVPGQSFDQDVEVVGGFGVSLGQIRSALQAGIEPDTDQLRRAREWALGWLELELGVALRPRYARQVLDGSGTDGIVLSHRRPRRVRSLSVDGSPWDDAAIAALSLRPSGLLRRLGGAAWPAGAANVEVVYEHGLDEPPAPVVRAILRLAAFYLTENPLTYDERASSIHTEEADYTLVTPGLRGAVFALPEVNAVIQEFGFVGAG